MRNFAIQGKAFVEEAYVAQNFRCAVIREREVRRSGITSGEIGPTLKATGGYQTSYKNYMDVKMPPREIAPMATRPRERDREGQRERDRERERVTRATTKSAKWISGKWVEQLPPRKEWALEWHPQPLWQKGATRYRNSRDFTGWGDTPKIQRRSSGCDRFSDNLHQEQWVNLDGVEELTSPHATNYENRKGRIRRRVCKNDSNSDRTEDCPLPIEIPNRFPIVIRKRKCQHRRGRKSWANR